MNKPVIDEHILIEAASHGADEFLDVVLKSLRDMIGGELTAEWLQKLNADQITLLAYQTLRDEVMDGGFVQLIHNGYGAFFFQNPFAKAMKLWGLRDLSKLVYSVKDLYWKSHETIEKDCTDEEFMALFEQFPEFDNYDDEFVENEEQWTEMVAQYVDDHIERFATILE